MTTMRSTAQAAFARTTPMADDRHTPMAFVTPREASKCDLLPHPPAFQPHFHPCQTGLDPVLHTCPAQPPESIHLDGSIFVDHCQCFTTCKSHCITTHHNTPCLLNTARTCLAYVCLLALLCPCAFFGCDLLACMGHLIFSFLCKNTSAALQHVCLWARMCVWVCDAGFWVCLCVQNTTSGTDSEHSQR